MKTEVINNNTPAELVRLPAGTIERRIYAMRGRTIMLDHDLAMLYRVTTKAFNQAVKRNSDRFPSDFMFQLTADEAKLLRSQSVTLDRIRAYSAKKGRGRHSKYAPLVFTEHGIAMHALLGFAEQARGPNEYSYHPRVHSHARDADQPQGSRSSGGKDRNCKSPPWCDDRCSG